MSDISNLFESYFPEKDNINKTPLFVESVWDRRQGWVAKC